MTTKIVLNKKNSKDDYRIVDIQAFDGGKKKFRSINDLTFSLQIKLNNY